MLAVESDFELIPGELSLNVDLSVRQVRGILKQRQISRNEVPTYEDALAHPAVGQVQQTVVKQLARLFQLTGNLPVKGDQLLLQDTSLGFYAMLTIERRSLMMGDDTSSSTIIYNLDCWSRPEDPPLTASRWKNAKF